MYKRGRGNINQWSIIHFDRFHLILHFKIKLYYVRFGTINFYVYNLLA